MEKLNQCYDCQLKERESEIGNRKIFDDTMLGNTMVEGVCDTCKKKTGILPQGDFDRSVRVSKGEFVHPYAWD